MSRFYLAHEDRLAWCGPTGPKAQADALVRMLGQAAEDGLEPLDYGLDFIAGELERWRAPGPRPDLASLVRLDLMLTRAFFAYGSHLQRGRIDPRAIHAQWRAPVQAADLAGLLQAALDLHGVEAVVKRLRPPQAGYFHLRQALADYREIADSGGWPVVEKVGGIALVQRLKVTGDLQSDLELVDPEYLRRGLLRFEERLGLEPSERLDEATLAALNVPVAKRIAAIELNMERWRWLPHDPGTCYLLVRIADFELDAVEAGETVLNMRVIVGKPYWRTPIFSAQLTHLVYNPYWYIPRSISIDEVLPAIRRDLGYLERLGISVAEGEGLALSRVDPDSVDWDGLSVADFPYAFTQAPGPANPLGKIKFLFPNPYNVYLHDTPNTALFAERVRAFSHGCIRVEDSEKLAAYALRSEGSWTPDRIGLEVDTGINREIVLSPPLPVYLLYWTTWVNEEGMVQFRNDEYDADARLHSALRVD